VLIVDPVVPPSRRHPKTARKKNSPSKGDVTLDLVVQCSRHASGNWWCLTLTNFPSRKQHIFVASSPQSGIPFWNRARRAVSARPQMRLPSRTIVARRRTTLRPALVILVAALLIPFLCYLVADPDLDVFAHYDKANHQVQVQLTVLSAAQRAAQLRLRLANLPPFLEPATQAAASEPRQHETRLYPDLSKPLDVSLSAPPVLLI